ncbi:MAG: hypothetical protein KDJ47_08950 [Hyphomicrobiaceae bacterium]|nr:hypothetical protein [Hyphomicrobiaceae bacterium]
MSEVCIAADRFWRELSPDVAATFSEDQNREIERVLERTATPSNSEISDLRLSFIWFFVRISWGPEKRSSARIKQEQQMHPIISRRNAPVLASLFAGYAALWYVGLGLAVASFAYIMR